MALWAQLGSVTLTPRPLCSTLQNMPNVRDHDASIYLRLQGDALSVGGYETNPIFWEEVRHQGSREGLGLRLSVEEPSSGDCPPGAPPTLGAYLRSGRSPIPQGQGQTHFIQPLKNLAHRQIQTRGRWRACLKTSTVRGRKVLSDDFRRL